MTQSSPLLHSFRPSVQQFDSLYTRDRIDKILKEIDLLESESRELCSLKTNGFLLQSDLKRYENILGKYTATRTKLFKRKIQLVDLGCGIGELGHWLAKRLRAHVIGVDISAVAIDRARQSVANIPKVRRPHFQIADFTATGFRDGCIDVAISLDALYLASNPMAAALEARRFLVPGGLLLFTAYTSSSPIPPSNYLGSEWCPILSKCGFLVERCDKVTDIWRTHMRRKHERRWLARELLRQRLGDLAEPELSVSASMLGLSGQDAFLDQVQRWEILARRLN